jgi:hypothetical protein
MPSRLQHRQRRPGPLGLFPVDALKQHRQLGGCEVDLAIFGLGPDEAATLETLVTYLGMQAVLLPRRSLFA